MANDNAYFNADNSGRIPPRSPEVPQIRQIMEKMSISFTKCEIEEIRALLVNQEENYEEWGEKNNAEFVRGIIEKIDNNQKQ
jgi:hypothetical protein